MNYQSEQTNLVCQAIEDARLEFFPLEKSGVNNYFKNKKGDPHLYSTLDNIFDACMPALHKYKLSVVYQVRILEANNGIENIITTTITHLASSQYILSATTLGNQTAKSQDVGSAITYLRRYQIQAMLNLEADFEDDGNVASGRVGKESNIIETKEKVTLPSRKYVGFDKNGNSVSTWTSFTNYLSNLNAPQMKEHHAWCSVSIIHLQDVVSWAKELPKEHSRSSNAMIKKCDEQIKFIKGE